MGKRKGASVVRRPRPRWRTLRRWSFPAAGVLALAAAMTSAVRRGGEARLIYGELQGLRFEEQVVREKLAAAALRVDSLGSRTRIRDVAAELGLRPAREDEVTFLTEASVASETNGDVGGDEAR